MCYRLTETIIEYHPDDLDKWKNGEKEKWLAGRVVPPEVYNQPRYHFGEYFVVNYFEKAFWHGYTFYSLNESHLEKYQESYHRDKGEPDLFLYLDNGPKLFLEVKKEKDQISDAQLEYLAQIKGILKAEIGIIYLVKHDHQHTPKEYKLNLVTFEFTRVI